MATKHPNLADYIRLALRETGDSYEKVSESARARGHELSAAYLNDLSIGRRDPEHLTVRKLKALSAGLRRPLPEILIACGLLKASDLIPSRRPKPRPKATKKPKTVYVVLKDPPRKDIGFVPQKKRAPADNSSKKGKT